jgi:hypothetical protein
MNTFVAPFKYLEHLEKTFMSLQYHHGNVDSYPFLDHVLSVVT